MADVFLSYTRSDQPKASQIADAIRCNGYSVFYDVNLAPGDSWDRRIETELAAAQRVVVLWSAAAVDRQWVRNEARSGLQRGILCPALVGTCDIPIEFSHVQAADLRNWNGDQSHHGWTTLWTAITRSGNVFEPAYSPTPSRSRRYLIAGVVGASVIAAGTYVATQYFGSGATRYDATNLPQQILDAVTQAREAAHIAQQAAESGREAAQLGEDAADRAERGEPGYIDARVGSARLLGQGSGQRIDRGGHGVLITGLTPTGGGVYDHESYPTRFAGRFKDDGRFPDLGVMYAERNGAEQEVRVGSFYHVLAPDGEPPAYCLINYEDGSQFAGVIVGWDMVRGTGVRKWPDGRRFEGHWIGHTLHGAGVTWSANGRVDESGLFDHDTLITALGPQGG